MNSGGSFPVRFRELARNVSGHRHRQVGHVGKLVIVYGGTPELWGESTGMPGVHHFEAIQTDIHMLVQFYGGYAFDGNEE